MEKNFDGVLAEGTHDLLAVDARDWWKGFGDCLDRLAFNEALDLVMTLVGRANKYAEDKAPWKLVKTDRPQAQAVLSEMARTLKLAAVALHPFMPTMTQEIWRQIGETAPLVDAASVLFSTGMTRFSNGQKISKGAPLFPRKDAV